MNMTSTAESPVSLQDYPAAEVERPFYADPDLLEHLQSEYGVLPPKRQHGYNELETAVSSAFVGQYGAYLTEQQRNYFASSHMLFLGEQDAAEFNEHWRQNVHVTDPSVSAIDGVIYTDYHENDGRHQLTEADESESSSARVLQHWAGRIATYPLAEDEQTIAVSPAYLMTSKALLEKEDEDIDLQAFTYSNSIGAVMVHEKVHGIQDPMLPLPILEAGAAYYERTVFTQQNWRPRRNFNMKLLADLYADCVDDYGSDIHRLIFGNLTGEPQARALAYLKSRFTVAEIERLSSAEGHGTKLRWTTIPSEEM